VADEAFVSGARRIVASSTDGFRFVKAIKKFVANESGATAVRYALIASLTAIANIAAPRTLGKNIDNTSNEVSSKLS
jgi:pilus assembly protein Flp/PilA